MAQLDVGTEFAGYRIDSLVGRGGMGVVYRAWQLELERPVALKVIAPEALEDDAARTRFVSEARHAAAIEHPNVVPIYAAGECDGMAYFVMRFVEGDDLRTRVRRDGPLTPVAATVLIGGAAAALDAIHAAGLVHRDVKPANLLLGSGDHVYLTDFGLAREALSRGASTTGTGRWAGSLHYAAPEQIRGGRVDARADVYALGGVLVFMLTSRVPFDRDSDEAILWAHVSDSPPRPSELRRELPRALDGVVARAMAKSPDDRYASAGDLGRAAQAAAEGRRAPRHHGAVAQGAASPSGALALPGLSDEAPTLTAAAALPGAPPRRRLLVGGLSAAAVLALGLAALFARPGRDDDKGALAGGPSATASPKPAPAGPRLVTFRHVSHRPNGILRVGDTLWVTSASRPLMRIGALTGRPRERDATSRAGGKAVSAHGDRVWVANTRTDTVAALQAAPPHRMLRTVRLTGPPAGVAADGAGGVWVGVRGRGGPDTAVHYDAKGRMVSSTPLPGGIAAIAFGLHALWVSENAVAKIVRIDPRTGKALKWASLSKTAHQLAWAGGFVWATSQEDDSITRIDPHTPDHGFEQEAGHRPEQVAVAGGRLFVASYLDQTLLVLSPSTLRPVHAPIPVAHNPFAVTADAHHVWVTGMADDMVTRVDVP